MKYERSSARCRHPRPNLKQNVEKFPASFKFANLTLNFKQGSRNQKNNCRPISILFIISKIFEKLIRRQLLNHFDKFLSNFHCSFRKGYSLQFCLLLMIDKWKKAVDNNKALGALLADLSKAFDCILSWFTCSKIECLQSAFSCFKNDTGLCDSAGIWTPNLFVRKQILKHLAK